MSEPRLWRTARSAGCAPRGIRFACLFAAAALCQTVDAAVDAADPKSAASKTGSRPLRTYRAQSPGYGSQYELTGGNPASAPSNGPYSAPVANQSGQMPMGRTGPDSTSSGGTSRYPAPAYGAGGPPGRTVQYGPPGSSAAPGPSAPYNPGTPPPAGFGQPSYPPGGYT